MTPRVPPQPEPYSRFSGLEPLVIRPDTNFVNIGERTNVTGSPRFAELIRKGEYEKALAVARQQVEGGAQMIDVNMDEAMLDSEQGHDHVPERARLRSRTSRACPSWSIARAGRVIEAGLKCLQGKGIVNSISLKEGEDAFREQARKIRRYGAGVIVMAFDEKGQADTAERKAGHRHARLSHPHRRSRHAAVGHHLRSRRSSPSATGIEEHNTYAVAFLEATRQIKADAARRQGQRRRQQHFVFLPRQ